MCRAFACCVWVVSITYSVFTCFLLSVGWGLYVHIIFCCKCWNLKIISKLRSWNLEILIKRNLKLLTEKRGSVGGEREGPRDGREVGIVV